MWKRRNPAEVSDRILEMVASGELKTPGNWADMLHHLNRLPPRLRTYTWQKLALYLPPETVLYLKRWASQEVVSIA